MTHFQGYIWSKKVENSALHQSISPAWMAGFERIH